MGGEPAPQSHPVMERLHGFFVRRCVVVTKLAQKRASRQQRWSLLSFQDRMALRFALLRAVVLYDDVVVVVSTIALVVVGLLIIIITLWRTPGIAGAGRT